MKPAFGTPEFFDALHYIEEQAESYGLPLKNFIAIHPSEGWLAPYNEVVALLEIGYSL
jgi:hypothetical protein